MAILIAAQRTRFNARKPEIEVKSGTKVIVIINSRGVAQLSIPNDNAQSTIMWSNK